MGALWQAGLFDSRLPQDPVCSLFIHFLVSRDRDFDAGPLRVLRQIVAPSVDDNPSGLPQRLVYVFSLHVSLTSRIYYIT